jgi:hypothetical protein
MTIAYDEALPLRAARARYFEDNAFGPDGGYSKSWVPIQMGPIKVAIPNSAARVRAVKYHDLHHVVTGYTTDLVGEAEIGAWEIGSGCAGFVAAWILNLYAIVLGFCRGPRAPYGAPSCAAATRATCTDRVTTTRSSTRDSARCGPGSASTAPRFRRNPRSPRVLGLERRRDRPRARNGRPAHPRIGVARASPALATEPAIFSMAPRGISFLQTLRRVEHRTHGSAPDLTVRRSALSPHGM